MSASTRVVLTTGFAALSLAALAVTTAVPPMAMKTIQVVRPATFTAEVAADASGTPDPQLAILSDPWGYNPSFVCLESKYDFFHFVNRFEFPMENL